MGRGGEVVYNIIYICFLGDTYNDVFDQVEGFEHGGSGFGWRSYREVSYLLYSYLCLDYCNLFLSMVQKEF